MNTPSECSSRIGIGKNGFQSHACCFFATVGDSGRFGGPFATIVLAMSRTRQATRRRSRRLAVGGGLSLLLLAGTILACRWGSLSGISPQSLLAEPRDLPTYGWSLAGRMKPPDFQLTVLAFPDPSDSDWCSPFGRSTFRLWEDEGLQFATHIGQEVCREPSSVIAWLQFHRRSLASFATDAAPQFAEGPMTSVIPNRFGEGLLADEFEVGCGLGSANDVCLTWLFTARYGPFIVNVWFMSNSTPGVGITSEQFESVVGDIDATVATRVGSR